MPDFLFFCLDKFRNTSLKLRLARIAVGNYGFISLACFALSYEISRCKTCLDNFRNASLNRRLVALVVCKYALRLRAQFALSCKISRRKIVRLLTILSNEKSRVILCFWFYINADFNSSNLSV